MRRKDREIQDFQRMLDIMQACDCCRIGLVDEGEAYIVPMNFGVIGENGKLTLFFHGASEGRKLDVIRKNPKVSFEMDRKHELVAGDNACSYSYMYQCVMGTGTISLIEDTELKKTGLQAIMKHYTKQDMWEYNEAVLARVTVMQLDVESWSCKEH